MIIRVEDLEPDGLRVETPLEVGPLRTEADEPIGIHGAVFRGDVKRTSRGVELRGRFTCSAEVPCARCLVPFRVHVDRTLFLRYAFAVPAGRDVEIPEDDLDLDFLNADGELSLLDVAAEQIYLELPMKPICRESCRGLCSHCGADLNLEACRCTASLPQA